jgi:hypothetical protein
MSQAINDLVSMKDVESLLEIMNDGDDWMDQVDAAEGLVKLGDPRGLKYLMFTLQSDDADVRQVVEEVLDSPDVQRMREQIESDAKLAYQRSLEIARARLKKGGKVYLYKEVFLPSGDVMQEDLTGNGFHVPALDEAGMQGWEVICIVPRRRRIMTDNVDEQLDGAYAFLKKQLGPEEVAELDQ